MMSNLRETYSFWNEAEFKCPFCAKNDMPDYYLSSPSTDPISAFAHLESAHSIKIDNSIFIMPYFSEYLLYYSNYLDNMLKTDGFFSLGTTLLDVELRTRLLAIELDKVLLIASQERTQSPTQVDCIFCKSKMLRSDLFTHLLNQHNFNIGNPDNLVYINEFISKLTNMIDNRTCIYCTIQFPTESNLKTHLKKKKHYKISKYNHTFDKYYIKNYISIDKSWIDLEFEQEDEEDSDFSDWVSEHVLISRCLFCDCNFDIDLLKIHFKDHCFDIELLSCLEYYEYIRLINYIRDNTSHSRCFNCAFVGDLNSHFKNTDHAQFIPDKEHSIWTDEKWLVPFDRNDALLFDDVFSKRVDEE